MESDSVSKEVSDITVDIEEVIRSVPGASKYFRSGPAPKKPKKKPATTRQRPGPKPDKNQRKTMPASTAPVAGPSNTDTIDVDDLDDDIAGFHSLLPTHLENPLTFHFKKETGIASYYVSKPAPPATSRTVKAAAPAVAERGPFFFPLNSTFQQFCTRLSAAVGCRSPALNLPFTRWKFVKHGNDNLKVLGTEDGYKALIISLKERKKDLTIEVRMHPPLVLASHLPYETDDFKPPDAFDELDAPAASSVQQEITLQDLELSWAVFLRVGCLHQRKRGRAKNMSHVEQSAAVPRFRISAKGINFACHPHLIPPQEEHGNMIQLSSLPYT
ncbi:hypothetical protein DFH09DRAFT_1270807 [Mycena vulgaris]|nr:hypothetical protein DFH09DRAFT_1270807 [Mycena vulgaris]